MRNKLLNFICCPLCKKKFDLDIFIKEENEEIIDGALLCSCGQAFPIISGIPRILPENLMEVVKKRFPDFFSKYKNIFVKKNKSLISEEFLQKKRTSDSFGFEWEKFSEMRGEWRKNFNFYFEPTGKKFPKNNTALELGCGNGRHTFYASELFKDLIAVDLSLAVDVAYSNNKNQKNVHFIQTDIYNLPFEDKFFDFIFCIGVLHHLPNPEAGFKKLVEKLNNNGNILVYVYHSFSKKSFNFYLLSITNFFRNITTKLPHKLLFALCYPIAFLSSLILVWPYKFFFKKIVKNNWPLGAYADYSFFVMLNDTFDRFSAPIENRYSKEQVLGWFNRASLKDIKILGGFGWRVFGSK